MSRRIDLELTSARPDGTWTWRAAGALQPKGELDGAILPSESKVGDVLRADADFDIEGITVLSVLPPKAARVEAERLEIIGSPKEFQPVTSTLAARTERRDRGPRSDRPDRDRPDRDRPDRDRPPRGDRPDRPDRPPRSDGAPRGERPPRADGPARPRRERPEPPAPKPKPKKLRPGRAHRDELMAVLGAHEQPIAEQLFRGGMPGVRTALDEQNAKNATEGLPEVPGDTILGIAEQLTSRVRVADWLDRAEAARADGEEIALRDLRAVVTSAEDIARDDQARALLEQLRAILERRTDAEQSEWLRELTTSVQAGRTVRALRLASRPPQPGEAVPAELATSLATAAGAAMTAEIAPDRWGTLLDALAYSPLRRDVTPAGIPAEPGDELLALVRKHAGRTPAIAVLFGIEAPTAPSKRAGRTRPARPAALATTTAAPAAPAAKKIPPPPTRPAWMETPVESTAVPSAATATPGQASDPATAPDAPVDVPEGAPAQASAVADDAPAPAESAAEEAPVEATATLPDAPATAEEAPTEDAPVRATATPNAAPAASDDASAPADSAHGEAPVEATATPTNAPAQVEVPAASPEVTEPAGEALPSEQDERNEGGSSVS